MELIKIVLAMNPVNEKTLGIRLSKTTYPSETQIFFKRKSRTGSRFFYSLQYIELSKQESCMRAVLSILEGDSVVKNGVSESNLPFKMVKKQEFSKKPGTTV